MTPSQEKIVNRLKERFLHNNCCGNVFGYEIKKFTIEERFNKGWQVKYFEIVK
jgi:hypothetical protein